VQKIDGKNRPFTFTPATRSRRHRTLATFFLVGLLYTMDRERKARPSLVHLAAKFNTAPPPGYVPGRGRGVSGFTKPPPAPPRRGRGRRGADDAAASSNGAEVEDGAQYGDAEEEETEDAVAGADYEPDELDNSAVAFEAGGFDDEGKLKGEAGDTRALDLGGTEKFEVARTTMSQMEAGYEIEPFNMKQARARLLPMQRLRHTPASWRSQALTAPSHNGSNHSAWNRRVTANRPLGTNPYLPHFLTRSR
jgi:hypothetical protein